MSKPAKTVRQREADAVALRPGRFVYSAKRANRNDRRSSKQALRAGAFA